MFLKVKITKYIRPFTKFGENLIRTVQGVHVFNLRRKSENTLSQEKSTCAMLEKQHQAGGQRLCP